MYLNEKLTSSSDLSERTRSWEPFLTASSAASQSLFSVFSREPSTPFLILKNVGKTWVFRYGSFNKDSSSPSFRTGLDKITWLFEKKKNSYYLSTSQTLSRAFEVTLTIIFVNSNFMNIKEMRKYLRGVFRTNF